MEQVNLPHYQWFLQKFNFPTFYQAFLQLFNATHLQDPPTIELYACLYVELAHQANVSGAQSVSWLRQPATVAALFVGCFVRFNHVLPAPALPNQHQVNFQSPYYQQFLQQFNAAGLQGPPTLQTQRVYQELARQAQAGGLPTVLPLHNLPQVLAEPLAVAALFVRRFIGFNQGLPAPLRDHQSIEMDQATRGDSALSNKDFTSAITHYTEAININPTAVKYYIHRATAYTRLSPSDHASSLKDSEIAVSLAFKRKTKELIIESQMRRAIALFGLEHYGDSKQCIEWIKKKINAGDKKNNTVKMMPTWEMKVDKKLKDLEGGDEKAKITVKENPDVQAQAKVKPVEKAKSVDEPEGVADTTAPAQISSVPVQATAAPAQSTGVQTPASNIRHEWYQNNDTIIVTLYCKGIDKVTVDITARSLEVSFPLPTGSDFNFSIDPLLFPIDRMKSYYKIMSTKAEFTLMKLAPGQKWATLEGTEAVDTKTDDTNSSDPSQEAAKRAALAPKHNSAGPAYPTSSKSGPKNWDKVANDLSKRSKKEAKDGEEEDTEYGGIDDDEADPTMGFFKTLYKGADEDTKRAMMKSYQESNGTALSTNWSEVGKGKVETSPPDGMEAKKWD